MTELLCCIPRRAPDRTLADNARAARSIVARNLPQRPSEPDARPDALAVRTDKYWGGNGVRLTVGFVDTTPRALRDRIISHLNAWNDTANVLFTYTAETRDAEVRINREDHPAAQAEAWDGYWSFVGTDVLVAFGPYNQTMNLQGFTENTSEAEFRRVVRHEAGHTLGFPHEHMRAELIGRIDEQKAIDYYRRLVGWSEQETRNQVLTPLDPELIRGTTEADPDSIMCYHVPASITTDGRALRGGDDINQSDYTFVAGIYPKPELQDPKKSQ